MYEYDVFISYKVGKIYGRWVYEVFFDFFKEYLDQELGRTSDIFLDKQSISNGDAWPERIKRSLLKSKCLVALLSPLYFTSLWCKKEISVMLFREERLGYRTLTNPSGLISAATLHDGDRFPEIINKIQSKNWQNFAIVGKGFENTKRYIEFQDQLKVFAKHVADIVRTAPEWENRWMSVEWLDVPVEKYSLTLSDNKIKQPFLS
ncbi:hypothetical protein MHK_001503 [Candidatus Magnetomorum sp. HK-1]|nr:hypothetical protein MHK_001503 [Candidatus Magnetomorum sp. HK-1]